MTRLQYLVCALDCALTNRPWKDTIHTMGQADRSDMLNPFASGDRCYYLSDGGYSRIFSTWDWTEQTNSVRLHLTSNSREEVKKQWPKCRELIAIIEQEILNDLRRKGELP